MVINRIISFILGAVFVAGIVGVNILKYDCMDCGTHAEFLSVTKMVHDDNLACLCHGCEVHNSCCDHPEENNESCTSYELFIIEDVFTPGWNYENLKALIINLVDHESYLTNQSELELWARSRINIWIPPDKIPSFVGLETGSFIC